MNSFNIPCEICNLNEYIKAERSNRFIAANIKKKTTQTCCLFAKSLNLDLNAQYDIVVNWWTKNKKIDSDNVFFGVKFILDGVVDAGKLLGDGYKQIRHIHHNRFIGDSKIEVIFNKVLL